MKPVQTSMQEQRNLFYENSLNTFITKLNTGGGV